MTYTERDWEADEEDDCVEGNSNVKLVMSKKLKEKLDYLSTDYTKSEIGGFITYSDISETDGEVTIVLDDLLIPPQEAKSSEVDIDGVGQIELRKEYGDRCLKIIGHWHSHHTMGTFFSGTDEDMMKSYAENKTFCLFIVSSKGKHLIRLVLKNKPFEIKIDNVEYEVLSDGTIAQEMEDEIKKKVKEPVVTTTTTITTKFHSNSSQVKQVKKEIEGRVRYYQHQNHKVKVERIFKYYADLIGEEFKILNPIASKSPQLDNHYDVIVELGDKNKAKEFMVDVKAFLLKTIMLEREKEEAKKDDEEYWKNYRRETTAGVDIATLQGEELQEYLDELEAEDEEYLSELEREETEDLGGEGLERYNGGSGRCSWNNYRDREQRRLLDTDMRARREYRNGYIDYSCY